MQMPKYLGKERLQVGWVSFRGKDCEFSSYLSVPILMRGHESLLPMNQKRNLGGDPFLPAEKKIRGCALGTSCQELGHRAPKPGEGSSHPGETEPEMLDLAPPVPRLPSKLHFPLGSLSAVSTRRTSSILITWAS